MVKEVNGTSTFDILVGTSDVDFISAEAGNDFIYGFTADDTIDGGAGYDTLVITGTLQDFNNAADAQLLNIEEVSAKTANGGVRISLAQQTEGFTLTGSSHNDTLTGGRGADLINAGDGDDIIYGFDINDTVNGGAGLDTVIITANMIVAKDQQLTGIENIIASSATAAVTINLSKQTEKFFIAGSAYDDEISGGAGADVINSGAGNDRIIGFTGNDFINAGAGNDTLVLTSTSVFLNAAMDYQLVDVEVVTAASATAGVMLDLSVQSEAFSITGSASTDTLKGGQGADIFFSSLGEDVIDGGFGEDKLFLTTDLRSLTNAQLTSIEIISAENAQKGLVINLGAQNERFKLTGGAYADTITGGLASDLIDSGGGNDTIIGFAGLDTLDGGTGSDTLFVSATSLNLNTATDDQLKNIETVSAETALISLNINLSNQKEGLTIIGGNAADILKGGSGDDTFVSFYGNDFIDGGQGYDTLVIKSSMNSLNGASDAQLINVEAISAADATAGIFLILANQTDFFTIFDPVKNKTVPLPFTITGSSFADVITGTAQSDNFINFLGADKIDGGGGFDSIVISATSIDLNNATNAQISNIERISAVSADAGVRIDMSKQAEAVEILGGAFDDTLKGGGGNDAIRAGGGDDSVLAQYGNDLIDGGDGYDTLFLTETISGLNGSSDGQLVNLEAVTAAGAKVGVVINLEKQSDGFKITGGSFADLLKGSMRSDTFIDFTKKDTVNGGDGADTIILTSTSTALNDATDDQLVNVEAISAATATSSVVISLANQTTATEGFSITGGLGADKLTGGSGDDSFMGFVAADSVDGGDGADAIVLTATSTTLNAATDDQLANVEAISALGATAGVFISLVNQAAANEGFSITGGGGADTLTGGSGDDSFIGFAGADTVDGGGGLDTIILTATSAGLNNATNSQLENVEVVSAVTAAAGVMINLANQTTATEGFSITGGGGADTITGGSGGDNITTGAGDDRIIGFVGEDTIEGGEGTDTLVLVETSSDFVSSIADDDRISGVEIINASQATLAVNITLTGQSEGFAITGGAGADTLTGGSGDDTFTGFAGADTLDGGDGADAILLTATSTTLNEATDAQLMNVEAVSAETATAGVNISLVNQTAATENFVITGGFGADTIAGGSGDDLIATGAGNDGIIDFSGADTVDGGDGTDTLILTATSATLNQATDDQLANVEAVSAATATAGLIINLANQTTATEGFSITGGGGADTITGGSAADTFIGFVGADVVDGGDGEDTLILTATSTSLNQAGDSQLENVEAISAAAATAGLAINLALQTTATEGFSITGGAGADTLTGGSGDDTFLGFAGADAIDGGDGEDIIVLTATSATLNEATDGQLVQVEAIVLASTVTTGVIINLANQTTTTEGFSITGGGAADTLAGGSGDDTIIAEAGNDRIVGFTGADTIDGGDGLDTLVLLATSTSLNEAADDQLANVEAISAATVTTGVVISLANQTTSTEGFSITGGVGADTLTGGSGADTFIGFVGADTVDGGDGDDAIILTSTSSTLNEAGDDQLVNVEAISAATVTAGVVISLANQTTTTEGFSITGGMAADSLTGGAGDDNILAGAGNDRIIGFVGADTIDGGGGVDTIVLAATSTDLNTATDSQLVNVEAVSASSATAGVIISLANQTTATEGFTITGGGGADTLTGGSGADTFIGFAGADALDGGGGLDTLVLIGTSNALNSATDSQLVNVEAISASTAAGGVTINLANQTTASEGFSITGGLAADALTGGSGNDNIRAGGGNDTIYGFAGADTIDGGDGADTLVLTATSTGLNNASNSQLVNVEAISAATSTAGVIISLANQITSTEGFSIIGGAGADSLNGGSGNDTINGGAGNDTITGFIGSDIVDGGEGADTIALTTTSAALNSASNSQLMNVETISAAMATQAVSINLKAQSESFSILGGGGADTIVGGIGADTLRGGAGADSLTGGLTGANTYDYTNFSDSRVNGFDTITDFKSTDKIKVANAIASGNFKTATSTASGDLARDLSLTLTAMNFIASGATLVTVGTGASASRYLVLNDATAAFNASSDAVIKVVGSVVTASNLTT